MKIGHTYDHFRSQVQPALVSKLEEFSLLGYGSVAEHEVWEFLKRKKWKKKDEGKQLFEIVEDILSIKVGDYFSFATIEAFKGAEFAFNNEEELRELLK
ncbi:post-transcriptional regulator [Bacillus sp. FJAT-29790]|uniref:post-transcriptional regulator n=1 Tax=Bacillus sp. FJAT-29790 TaxID=1895002 RepID=UPI001C24DF93|nr:post-transcriptional regulator [Bacillus sp. FJAT-29790]MBU8879524.1 post-transcriptional regulator [Bacillus sp. FJAT-29790]